MITEDVGKIEATPLGLSRLEGDTVIVTEFVTKTEAANLSTEVTPCVAVVLLLPIFLISLFFLRFGTGEEEAASSGDEGDTAGDGVLFIAEEVLAPCDNRELLVPSVRGTCPDEDGTAERICSLALELVLSVTRMPEVDGTTTKLETE